MLPAWEDESGLEDLDLDSLVSQHRSRVSPPIMPASKPDLFQQQHTQQRTVRPAAAAAAAVVRSSALPVSSPPVTLPRAPTTTHAGMTISDVQEEPPKYPAEASGLEGVRHRVQELATLILDAGLEPKQEALLRLERKHLMGVQLKLERAAAEPQFGRPPPDFHSGTPSNLPSSAPPAASMHGCATASVRAAATSGASCQATQVNSWQPSSSQQQQPLAAQRINGRSQDVWDTAAPSSNAWGQVGSGHGQGHGPPVHSGSGNYAYDAPDPAPRDDMGMAEPDPALRASASGEAEGFVTCHQHDGLVDKRWEKNFPWSSEMQRVLEGNFGTKTFRANQRQAINASLEGKDVFVLMPTGGGKLYLFVTCPTCHLSKLLTCITGITHVHFNAVPGAIAVTRTLALV